MPPDALSRHWIVRREIESEEKNKSGREGEGKIRERHNRALSLSPLNFFFLLFSPSLLSVRQEQAKLTGTLRKIFIPISIILAS